MTETLPPAVRLKPLVQLLKIAAWRLTLPHDRADHVLIWITRGQGLVTLNGVRRGLGAHNALFVPRHTLFSLDPGAQCLGMMLIVPATADVDVPGTALHLRCRDTRDQSELTGHLDAIQRELSAQRPLHDQAVAAQVNLIGVWLRRQTALGHSDAPKSDAAQRLVQRFAARIVADPSYRCSMTDHAVALSVTPTHLTRVCRKVAGHTAADLLTLRRVHAARSLLVSGQMSFVSIANQLGFASASYFTRFVIKHTGQTPSQLRQSDLSPLDS